MKHLIKENSVLSSSTHNSANETRKLGLGPGLQSCRTLHTDPILHPHSTDLVGKKCCLERMSAVIVEKKKSRAIAKKSRDIKKIFRTVAKKKKTKPEQLHSMSESGAMRIAILIWLCLGLTNRNFLKFLLKPVERPDPSGRTLNELSVDRELKDYAAESFFYLFTTYRKMTHKYKMFAERTPLQGET